MRLLALLFVAASAPMPQADVPHRLAAEMQAIRAETAASTPEDQQAAPLGRIERAQAALDSGRPWLALYLLEQPWESAKAWTFAKASSAACARSIRPSGAAC